MDGRWIGQRLLAGIKDSVMMSLVVALAAALTWVLGSR